MTPSRSHNADLASDIVELVLLTADEPFLRMFRQAVGSSRRVWHVQNGDKVSDLLLAGQVGIAFFDMDALQERPSRFLARIQRQFPDLIVVVAGSRETEAELAPLISAGVIFRYVHKPLSPARARLFADAAVKRYEASRSRAAASAVAGPSTPRRKLILIALGAVLAAGMLTWGALRSRSRRPAEPSVSTVTEASLLDRAAAALAANRLTAPSGDNALELYLRAVARSPADPAARSGLAEVRERLLARAENALLEEQPAEAADAIETARRAGVESGRITFLTAELEKLRLRPRARGKSKDPS